MEDAPQPKKKAIEYRYLRAPDHRFYHADGYIGGWSPSGNLVVDGFVERGALPDIIVQEITEQGVPGKETGRQGGGGIIRERTFGMIINPAQVVALRDFLVVKIEEATTLGLFTIKKAEED